VHHSPVGSEDEMDDPMGRVILANDSGRLRQIQEGLRGMSKIWGYTGGSCKYVTPNREALAILRVGT
jgi:hypothetical protein